VVHHSVTPRDQTLQKSLSSFSNSHKARLHPTVNSLGYHIAYHYVIWGDGTIAHTRADGDIWFHAGTLVGNGKTMNARSIGICLVGNFDKEVPSPEQYTSLYALIEELKKKYKITKVIWHNEVDGVSKSCPWKNFDFSHINNSTMPKDKMDMLVISSLCLNSNLYDILDNLGLTDTQVKSLRELLQTINETRDACWYNHRMHPLLKK